MHDQPVISKQTLIQDLKALGLTKGDLVLIHSSLKRVGWIEDGPETLIQAVLDVIGPEGTIVTPTIISSFKGLRPLFDKETSPSEVGLLTETLRSYPGALRSDHPTHSVAALGPAAEEIVKEHNVYHSPYTLWGRGAFGFESPWDKLRILNARVLMIGVGFTSCTMLHHAQVHYYARHLNTAADTPYPSFNFEKMARALETTIDITRGRIGNAEGMVFGAQELIDGALRILEDMPREVFDEPEILEWMDTVGEIRRRGRGKAAVFKIDITPEISGVIVGRSLHLRGLLIEDYRRKRAAILVWDILYGFSEDADIVRNAVSEATGIPRESILLVATHNHSSKLSPHGDRALFDDFVARTAHRAAASAAEAMGELEPVRIGWTCMPAPGIRRNRTVYMKDGRAYTDRWSNPSTWNISQDDISHRGPDDDDLRILVVERLDRSRLAVVANFSCHNSAAMHDESLNDDFFGVAMEVVETTEGNGNVTLCTPGSEGDQDPVGLIKLGGDRNLAYAEKLGRRLAGYILIALADVTMNDMFEVRSSSVNTNVEVREDWKKLAEDLAVSELQRWRSSGKAPVEITALSVGEYAIAGMPVELFTNPARKIIESSPFEITSVFGVTNGNICYVPESEAFFEKSGIYGVHGNSLPAMAQKGSDRTIVEASIRALKAISAGARVGL